MYARTFFCIISIYVAAVLSIEKHFEPQIILVDCTFFLYPIYFANVNKECYRGPLGTVPDY